MANSTEIDNMEETGYNVLKTSMFKPNIDSDYLDKAEKAYDLEKFVEYFLNSKLPLPAHLHKYYMDNISKRNTINSVISKIAINSKITDTYLENMLAVIKCTLTNNILYTYAIKKEYMVIIEGYNIAITYHPIPEMILLNIKNFSTFNKQLKKIAKIRCEYSSSICAI